MEFRNLKITKLSLLIILLEIQFKRENSLHKNSLQKKQKTGF